jgi:hypothetical protein
MVSGYHNNIREIKDYCLLPSSIHLLILQSSWLLLRLFSNALSTALNKIEHGELKVVADV